MPPGQGRTEIVTYMVNTEEGVVDDAFDQVEDAPAGEHQTEVEAPVRRQPALTPRGDGGDRAVAEEDQVATWKTRRPACSPRVLQRRSWGGRRCC